MRHINARIAAAFFACILPWLALAEDTKERGAADIAAAVRDLGHIEELKRDAARRRLLEIGRPAAPALLAVLDDPDVEVRESAREILSSLRVIPPDTEACIRKLTETLKTTRDIQEGGRAYLELAALDWMGGVAVWKLFPEAPGPGASLALSVATREIPLSEETPPLMVRAENTGKEPLWISVNSFTARLSGERDSFRLAYRSGISMKETEYDLIRLEPGARLELPFAFLVPVGAARRVEAIEVEVRYDPEAFQAQEMDELSMDLYMESLRAAGDWEETGKLPPPRPFPTRLKEVACKGRLEVRP